MRARARQRHVQRHSNAGHAADDVPAGPVIDANLILEPLVSGLDAKVLVLNRYYAAVRVITARRALCLLFKEHAEVICVEDGHYLTYAFDAWLEIADLQWELERERHDWVHAVTCVVAVPRVIRLFSYDRIPRERVRLTRRNLFARERNQCMYCGTHVSASELTIDHVIPRSRGGEDSWENLVAACRACNARKGGRTPDEAGMTLQRQPRAPRRNPSISTRLGSDRYASWRPFLHGASWTVEAR
jgi:5-methylcytosine-specific restriction endonuclease McrA